MIKRLPPAEREEVRAFVSGNGDAAASAPQIRYIPKEEYEKFAPKIFEENRGLLLRLAQ